ncbi:MAG: T9SS type A sorting domain-containing protein, partial [Saprospiraceae bacterium]|nr:T9SS type A sorting domain-containing protein [Saprospiraceae bacterium]
PNPAKRFINSRINDFHGLAAEVSLVNSLGIVQKKINLPEIDDQVLTIDVRDLESGVYWLHVLPQNRKALVQKVVIDTGK